MTNSFDKLRELNITRDEVNRIGEALKKPEFRKLLCEYVEELQDPENKKRYEEEIVQLEKERGVDVTFIHPNAGYVIKTSVNGNQKAFVNICSNENVKKPASSPTVKEGARGLNWSLPHTLSPPRDDIDNKGVRCQVFDVVFHLDALHLASKNSAFRTMVNNTALDAVEANFDVKLDKKNLKFPKLSYKGMPHPSVVRTPSEKLPEHSAEEKQFYDNLFSKANLPPVHSPSKKQNKTRKNSSDDNSEYTTPKYIIKHRTHVDLQEFTDNKNAKLNTAIPKELVVVIDLPLLKSSGDISVEVTEKTVQLVSEKPAKYKLDLTLPYRVNDSIGNAKFNKDLKQLVITLPVKNCMMSAELSDSGVESDHGGLCSPECDDEPSGKICDFENVEPIVKCLEQHPCFRTMFLDKGLHYSLPEFSCHLFENVLAFTLNVKNVDEKSVGKIFPSDNSVHVKFTSIGSSFYPSHYAFMIQLPESINQDDTIVEVWDNNVVLQVPVKCSSESFASYFYGTKEEDLKEKFVEEPEVVKTAQQEESSGESKELNENINLTGNSEKEVKRSRNLEESKELFASNPSIHNAGSIDDHDYHARAIDIAGTSCESSGDELSCSSYSPRKNKGILKRLSIRRFPPVGRSISESSLDDIVCSSSFENCHHSLDLESGIPEDGETEVSTSLKKTVRFNDVVVRQLFRSNSSILGQKKKNQRKAQKKKRALERRHSESEASEVEEKKEGESKDCHSKENDEAQQAKVYKQDDHDIFHLDMV